MAYDFRKKIITFSLIYGSIALLLLAFTYWLNFDIKRRAVFLDQKRSELAVHTSDENVLLALRRDAERAETEQVFLESILPQQQNLINFRGEVNRLAKQTNLTSASFSFGEERAGDSANPGYVVFNIRTTSPFLNWISFLDLLERGKYLISSNQVNLSKSGGEFTSDINGQVFSQ